jgi:hypothetical protein
VIVGRTCQLLARLELAGVKGGRPLADVFPWPVFTDEVTHCFREEAPKMTSRIRWFFALLLVVTIAGLVGFRWTPHRDDALKSTTRGSAIRVPAQGDEAASTPSVCSQPTILSAPMVPEGVLTPSPYVPPAPSGFRGYVGDTDDGLPAESPKVEFLPIPLLGGSHLP